MFRKLSRARYCWAWKVEFRTWSGHLVVAERVLYVWQGRVGHGSGAGVGDGVGRHAPKGRQEPM